MLDVKYRMLANLPRELIGETGVRKKRTEVTITPTRFTQFPTEWVTGDTLCNSIYATCTKYAHQQCHKTTSHEVLSGEMSFLSYFTS